MGTVMVVDDSAFMRQHCVALVQELGHDTVEACDGREAVEVYQRNKPEAVLMDITMPNMDGLEALHEINPQHSRAYQEKGHHWMVKREIRPAIDAFEQAVDLDPALIISWNALIRLYGMDNNPVGVKKATVYAERLKSLPQELLNVSSLIN